MSIEETAMNDNRDISDVSPTSLSHLIGQRCVVEQLTVALDAAHQDGKTCDSALLTGGAGLGKTQTAKVIASEMASGFHEVLGQSIANSADFNGLLLKAQDKDVVFIDEAHLLPKEYQTSLFIAID